MILIIVAVVSGGVFVFLSTTIDDTHFHRQEQYFCQQDSDCKCGVHKYTQECFLGNNYFVNPNESLACLDFCSGNSGDLVIRCVENICVKE